jgi:CopG antitoxin of type II toxin-antitoxin system
MEGTMKTQRLPQTDSIQELAHFWDTHDLTDFEDELEEVNEPVFELATVIPLNLESDEAEAVRRMAEAEGIADAELIRGWVREKIHAG